MFLVPGTGGASGNAVVRTAKALSRLDAHVEARPLQTAQGGTNRLFQSTGFAPHVAGFWRAPAQI